ncbi:MAG: XRE family transcriptional regulator [Cyclobacteriaceae bacterium]|nr:MAG: XRE family transcriptional regulator [Cyclobacteriaceae bacterium]
MWTIIQTKREYDRALDRIEELSVNPPSPKSSEGKELMLLGFLVSEYEETNFPIQYPDPIEAIKVRMEDLGLAVNDLLPIFGDKGTASKVLNRQRALSISMIRELSRKLSLPAELLIRPVKRRNVSKGALTVREPREKYSAKKRK